MREITAARQIIARTQAHMFITFHIFFVFSAAERLPASRFEVALSIRSGHIGAYFVPATPLSITFTGNVLEKNFDTIMSILNIAVRLLGTVSEI